MSKRKQQSKQKRGQRQIAEPPAPVNCKVMRCTQPGIAAIYTQYPEIQSGVYCARHYPGVLDQVKKASDKLAYEHWLKEKAKEQEGAA